MVEFIELQSFVFASGPDMFTGECSHELRNCVWSSDAPRSPSVSFVIRGTRAVCAAVIHQCEGVSGGAMLSHVCLGSHETVCGSGIRGTDLSVCMLVVEGLMHRLCCNYPSVRRCVRSDHAETKLIGVA